MKIDSTKLRGILPIRAIDKGEVFMRGERETTAFFIKLYGTENGFHRAADLSTGLISHFTDKDEALLLPDAVLLPEGK